MNYPAPSLAFLALLSACSGASSGPSLHEDLHIRFEGGAEALVRGDELESCSAESENDPAKLWPARESLMAKLGQSSERFIVLMKRDYSLEEYPIGGNRSGEDDAQWNARKEVIARSQACAIAAVDREGGEYIESFVLINAFVADLTVAQAAAVSVRADVRLVQASEEDSPPP